MDSEEALQRLEEQKPVATHLVSVVACKFSFSCETKFLISAFFN